MLASTAGAGHYNPLVPFAETALEPYSDGIVERIVATPYVSRFPASTDPSPYPITRRYRDVVPSPSRSLPDWWPGDDRPLVYVTFGSVAGGVPVGSPGRPGRPGRGRRPVGSGAADRRADGEQAAQRVAEEMRSTPSIDELLSELR